MSVTLNYCLMPVINHDGGKFIVVECHLHKSFNAKTAVDPDKRSDRTIHRHIERSLINSKPIS